MKLIQVRFDNNELRLTSEVFNILKETKHTFCCDGYPGLRGHVLRKSFVSTLDNVKKSDGSFYYYFVGEESEVDRFKSAVIDANINELETKISALVNFKKSCGL